MRLESIPLPSRMQSLPRDHRGYPIPYVIIHDAKGCPMFVANDSLKQRDCVYGRLCPICGSKLDSDYWFVGGPGSGLDPQGVYLDSAMHHECMTYALMVCPYLAMRGYKPPDSDILIPKLEKRLGNDDRIFYDPTVDMATPTVFVAVMAHSFAARERGYPESPYLIPERPYHAVEFWRHGQRLTTEEGLESIVAIPGLDLDALRLVR